jgi:hypothetical protein
VVIALGRLKWAGTPEWIAKYVTKPDAPLARAAVQAMRAAGNWPAVLKLLDRPTDDPVRPIALWTLAAGAARQSPKGQSTRGAPVLPRGSAVRPDRLVATMAQGRADRCGRPRSGRGARQLGGRTTARTVVDESSGARQAASEVRLGGCTQEHRRHPTEERVQEWKAGSVPSAWV